MNGPVFPLRGARFLEGADLARLLPGHAPANDNREDWRAELIRSWRMPPRRRRSRKAPAAVLVALLAAIALVALEVMP